LNIQENPTENTTKKKLERKTTKDLFSADEFKKLRTQVKRDKSHKPNRKGKISTSS